VESRDAVLWSVNYTDRTCLVKIQGSTTLIQAAFPQNWQVTPVWMKPGNSVRIIHKGGIRGNIEVAGHGMTIPTATQTGATVTPGTTLTVDSVLTGCNLYASELIAMRVIILTGTIRFLGLSYDLSEILMNANTEYVMGDGGYMSKVAGAKNLTAAPAVGLFRIDVISCAVDFILDLSTGTASALPVQPALSTSHVLIGTIQIPGGAVNVDQHMINKPFVAPFLSTIEIVAGNEELEWQVGLTKEWTTTLTVSMKDQHGNPIAKGDAGGWYITLRFLRGNGYLVSSESGRSLTSVGQHAGSAGTSVVFDYQRLSGSSLMADDSVDSSPMIQAEIAGYRFLAATTIRLLNAAKELQF